MDQEREREPCDQTRAGEHRPVPAPERRPAPRMPTCRAPHPAKRKTGNRGIRTNPRRQQHRGDAQCEPGQHPAERDRADIGQCDRGDAENGESEQQRDNTAPEHKTEACIAVVTPISPAGSFTDAASSPTVVRGNDGRHDRGTVRRSRRRGPDTSTAARREPRPPRESRVCKAGVEADERRRTPSAARADPLARSNGCARVDGCDRRLHPKLMVQVSSLPRCATAARALPRTRSGAPRSMLRVTSSMRRGSGQPRAASAGDVPNRSSVVLLGALPGPHQTGLDGSRGMWRSCAASLVVSPSRMVA